VYLEAVGPVFEIVADANLRGRELADLAHGDEARADAVGDGRAQNEAAAFDADDEVDALLLCGSDMSISKSEPLGSPGVRRRRRGSGWKVGDVSDAGPSASMFI
jgi:hypothetical protein